MAELSPTMREAVDYARQHGGKIVRYPGGYWARKGWIYHERNFGTTTIQALVSRGAATYTEWQQRKDGSGRFPIEVTVNIPASDEGENYEHKNTSGR